MKNYDADLIIVGGGLVGAALALALKNTSLSIILLEGREPVLDFDLATWDQRVYAISRASRKLLTQIGAWERMRAERLSPISAMKIRGDEPNAKLEFNALESGVDELAYIVENRELQRALWLELASSPNVEIITPTEPESLVIDHDGATLTLSNNRALQARLVVGADGANSWVRRHMKIDANSKPYEQFGVVANFACEKPHYGAAQQWFKSDSILAWLPLPQQQMSMVWSCSENQKDELLRLSAEQLAAKIAQAGSKALGELTLVTPPAAFPLKLTHVASCVAARVALVGDAAHTVHPLAGQGVNLGFGDVAELANLLTNTHPERIGDVLVLRRYERARRESVLLMQTVCDGLQKLFNNQNSILKSLRNFGLGFTDSLPWIKRQLIRHAMDS
ncbi:MULTISPECIES: UbiH/UbiF family hydroxylase [Deefgea]|uniref:UbiH/UbiF family hydroxylase n=1 Tax=Deefgea chitinilytica TaxID=570276 RepID=A0ABS2C7P1_9NEIS|nr:MULTISPECIES: UbiH/UbiF family hydroxylase [Deefgea]MBM5570170.1 UbiH/UbiF family hydroxylase [Deefgea chitinilytica]MBM9887399.1 UbiH/UbiF family hydroxylase [Deefgea sp. CFH1-16]